MSVATEFGGFTLPVCAVVGAPSVRGQTLLDGVQHGPKFLREGGLGDVISICGKTFEDSGDAFDPVRSSPVRIINGSLDRVNNSVIVGSSCEKLYRKVYEKLNEGKMVVTLGGDHSIATGSISGSLKKYPNLIVFWVDAHADINTPITSPSGNYHGMTSGHLLRLFQSHPTGFDWIDEAPSLKPQDIVYIGLRDLDEGEQKHLKNLGIKFYAMPSIDKMGIGNVMMDAIQSIDPHGNRPIHLSFDIDACDPSIAPGTGTKLRGGLSYREAHYICETIAETNRLVSMDMVEVNPTVDEHESFDCVQRFPIRASAPKTVRLALELIGSAVGVRII